MGRRVEGQPPEEAGGPIAEPPRRVGVGELVDREGHEEETMTMNAAMAFRRPNKRDLMGSGSGRPRAILPAPTRGPRPAGGLDGPAGPASWPRTRPG